MRNIKMLEIDLRLFDGAAAGTAAGGDGTSGTVQGDQSALPKAGTNGRIGGGRRSKTGGAFDNVVYGKQGDAPADQTAGSDAGSQNGAGNANKSGVSTTSDALEAKRKAYRDLMDGEYKDIYTEDTQRIINHRFREVKSLEESLSAQKPILDMLMQRYKVADGDISKLQKALEEDNTYWEAAADQAGMSVDQFKAVQKLERESAELRQLRQRQQGEKQMQEQLNRWYQESQRVKELYPSFDLKAEVADPNFLGLLKAGIPVQQAYELKHMEEIKANAARAASQATGQQMAAKIKSKAARPSENGTSSQSAVIVKNDVSKLTAADRAEIARRVARGEIISF